MKKVLMVLMAAALVMSLGAAGCKKPADKGGDKASAAGKAEPGKEAAAPAAEKKSEVADFGAKVCEAAKGGPSDFIKLFNVEFPLRITITEDQLKASGVTIDQLIAQAKEGAEKGMEDATKGEDNPEKCEVTKAEELACADLYKKLVDSKDVHGMQLDAARVEAAGTAMGLESCGVITLKSEAKGKVETPSMAVAKNKDGWSVLTLVAP